MRLSLSNLSWGGPIDGERCDWVIDAGLDAIEVAPTAFTGGRWPEEQEVRTAVAAISDAGLRVSGLQSLLFGCDDCHLFAPETWPRMLNRLRRCVDLGQILGADVLVFGSPKNRRRGHLPSQEAALMAADFFGQLVPDLEAARLTLTLEPNPPQYGADFMTHYADVLTVVDAIGSANVQPQIDTGCLTLAGDDPFEAARLRTPTHVHVSAPGLGELSAQTTDCGPLSELLNEQGYVGWMTLEMLRTSVGADEVLSRSVAWAVATLGGE